MPDKDSRSKVKAIPTAYAERLDPPLARKALEALLEKREAEFYQECEAALLDNRLMPDRNDFELNRLRVLIREL